jgi:hypothetical protein
MTDFTEIIKKVRKKKAVIFWGAGASLKAGAPSVSDIVSRLKTKLSACANGDIPSDDLKEVSQQYENIFGREKRVVNVQHFPKFFKESSGSVVSCHISANRR